MLGGGHSVEVHSTLSGRCSPTLCINSARPSSRSGVSRRATKPPNGDCRSLVQLQPLRMLEGASSIPMDRHACLSPRSASSCSSDIPSRSLMFFSDIKDRHIVHDPMGKHWLIGSGRPVRNNNSNSVSAREVASQLDAADSPSSTGGQQA